MKFFKKSYDGGTDSGVTGYWLVEIKPLFSIVLLKFNKGTRDAYHSHAFNALTIWLKGSVLEHELFSPLTPKKWRAGHIKYTPRDNIHMVEALTDTWALSIRGPWAKTWFEYKNEKIYELTHGRKVVRVYG
jgi:quercetin dioxygenase-like cupin family protein